MLSERFSWLADERVTAGVIGPDNPLTTNESATRPPVVQHGARACSEIHKPVRYNCDRSSPPSVITTGVDRTSDLSPAHKGSVFSIHMNSTLTSQHDLAFPVVRSGVGVLGLPTEHSAKRQLVGSTENIVQSLSSILNDMILDVIQKRTAEEFAHAVETTFPSYVALVLSYARIVSTIAPPETIARVTTESFSEFEADIRAHGDQAFGGYLRDRAVFTAWTLRKTASLLEQLRGSVAVNDIDREVEFLNYFVANALTARFHIDCLRASMASGRPIYPEVQPIIDEGLKYAVNAYAWIKQVVDLRLPSTDVLFGEYWTSEDDLIVKESMDDLAGDATSPDDANW